MSSITKGKEAKKVADENHNFLWALGIILPAVFIAALILGHIPPPPF